MALDYRDILIVFVTVSLVLSGSFVHELGHFIPALIFGAKPILRFGYKPFYLIPLYVKHSTEPITPFQDSIILLMGPIVSILYGSSVFLLSRYIPLLRIALEIGGIFLIIAFGLLSLIPIKKTDGWYLWHRIKVCGNLWC